MANSLPNKSTGPRASSAGGQGATKSRAGDGNLSAASVQATLKKAEEGARQSYEGMQHFVADNPASSLLIAFGAGLGLGVLVGAMLGEPPQPPKWYERHGADRYGRKLLDALAHAVPDSLSEKFSR